MKQIVIRKITLYHVEREMPPLRFHSRAYTTLPHIIAAVSDGKTTGFGECVPTSELPPGPGRSGINEWDFLKECAAEILGSDARLLEKVLPERMAEHDALSVRECHRREVKLAT